MDGHLGCFQLFILMIYFTSSIAVSCQIPPSAPFYGKPAQREGREGGRKDNLGVLKSSPKELKQEPGMAVSGEGLLQVKGGGRGQKPGLSQMHFFRSEGSRAWMA